MGEGIDQHFTLDLSIRLTRVKSLLSGLYQVDSANTTVSRAIRNYSSVSMCEVFENRGSPQTMSESEAELANTTNEVKNSSNSRMNFDGPVKATRDKEKGQDNKVLRLLEKNPLGMTLPEMAGGPRQVKKIKMLRPLLAEAIRLGLVMPVSQRAGSTVYKLVKNLGPR